MVQANKLEEAASVLCDLVFIEKRCCLGWAHELLSDLILLEGRAGKVEHVRRFKVSIEFAEVMLIPFARTLFSAMSIFCQSIPNSHSSKLSICLLQILLQWQLAVLSLFLHSVANSRLKASKSMIGLSS